MVKRRLIAFLIIIALLFFLKNFSEKKEVVLPAETEKAVEQVKEFFEEKALPVMPWLPIKEEEQKEAEKQIEEKVIEIVEEIKSLPEDQFEEIKKQVFCTEICETTCQEICD